MDDDRLDALFQDTEVRGDARTALDDDTLQRLGRAIGTLARRRGMERTTFVLGRDDHRHAARARDALLRGLLLAGHRVVDVGVASAEQHEFALNELVAPAGVRVAVVLEDGREHLALEIFLGGGPLVGGGLTALRDVLRQGDFAAGVGELEILDIEPAWHAAARRGAAASFNRDTVA